MPKKKTRRSNPNIEALAKELPDHGFLLMGDAYEQYEKEKQEYRETGIWNDGPTEQEVLTQYWFVLDNLIRLPEGPPNEASEAELAVADKEYQEIVHSDKVFEIVIGLQEINNVFLVLKRSIDFSSLTSKQIDEVIASSKGGARPRDLLTTEQKEFLQSLKFDAEHWADLSDGISARDESLVHAYLRIQNEIDQGGYISEVGRESLQRIKCFRSGQKRPREYSEAALILMLADFFEGHNEFNSKATIQISKNHIPKKEHEPEYDEDGKEIPWSPEYDSKFFDFLIEYQTAFELPDLGIANAGKLLRNRSKAGKPNFLKFCGLGSSKLQISKVIQIVDLLKP